MPRLLPTLRTARLAAGLVLVACAGCAGPSKAPEPPPATPATAPALERCDQPLGSLVILERQPAAAQSELMRMTSQTSTEPLLRELARQSNCFVVVDPGPRWRELERTRQLGAEQQKIADFAIEPQVRWTGRVSGLGAILGGLGGIAGAAGKPAATTTLVLVDTRSGVQVAASESQATLADPSALQALERSDAAAPYFATAAGRQVALGFVDSHNTVVKALRAYRQSSMSHALGNAAGTGQRPALPGASAAAAAATDRYDTVTVHFATNRLGTGRPGCDDAFGSERAPALAHGRCEVAIPRDHVIGRLEAPALLPRLFENPEQHVTALRLTLEDESQFWAGVRQRLAGAEPRSVLVFVHGYNTSFADAARRTAQVAHDIGFPGTPMFFSWPSSAALGQYLSDSSNAEWSVPDLRRFLRELLRRTDTAPVYLVAHSMGSRVLTRAWAALADELSEAERRRVRDVVLAAPDIDADVFRREIAPGLQRAGAPVTLYASSADLALRASREVNGFARAGDAGAGLVVASGVETIDATALDDDLLGHGYVLSARALLADLNALLIGGRRAGERFGLQPVRGDPRGAYWRLKR